MWLCFDCTVPKPYFNLYALKWHCFRLNHMQGKQRFHVVQKEKKQVLKGRSDGSVKELIKFETLAKMRLNEEEMRNHRTVEVQRKRKRAVDRANESERSSKKRKLDHEKKDLICIVCLEEPVASILLPCKHVITCYSCAQDLIGKMCPMRCEGVKEAIQFKNDLI